MKKSIIALAICLLVCAATAMAKFTVHSVSGSVKLERKGVVTTLEKGTEVGGLDQIIVGNNSAVEIHNSADTKVYRCDRPGKYTPTRIMMDARRSADSKFATMLNNMGPERERASKGTTVYSEGCVVTRDYEEIAPDSCSRLLMPDSCSCPMAPDSLCAVADTLPAPPCRGACCTPPPAAK